MSGQVMERHMFTNATIGTISGGTFNVHTAKPALDKLSAAAAHSALHNAPARTDESRCHQYTRINVLDRLERWAQGVCADGGSVCWLHGGAGAGKSAVMQTLAERFAAEGLALGSFFFSRSDPTRNTAEVLIPTLLYQIAQLFLSDVMNILAPVIERDPLIFKKSLQVQCQDLLVPVLQHLVQRRHISDAPETPRVILIDGLDECIDTMQQQAIIRAMAALCHEHRIPVHILIASRPEYAISTSFELYKEGPFRLDDISLSEDPDAEADIRRFVADEFDKMRTMHPFRHMIPSEWPGPYDINRLVWKSSSHFIYASTAVKYIWTTKENPVRSLEVVLGLQTSRTKLPFAELDSLYQHIFGSAAHLDRVLAILAYCMFGPLERYVQHICVMLECSFNDLSIFLADMGPLVVIRPELLWEPTDPSPALSHSETSLLDFRYHKVQFLHLSLRDFLCDRSRSGLLHISQEGYSTSTLERCFRMLNLFSQRQLPMPDWVITDWRLDLGDLYSLLRDHIFAIIHSTINTTETRELLRLYTLRNFHECQVSLYLRNRQFVQNDSYNFPKTHKFYRDGESVISDDFVRYLQYLSDATKTKDGASFFKSSLEDFFDIFESYLNLQGKPLAGIILPLLFSDRSLYHISRILPECYLSDLADVLPDIDGSLSPDQKILLWSGSMSLKLMNHFIMFLPRHLSDNTGNIGSSHLASIRHSINSSSFRLAEAAEAILDYLPAFRRLWRSSDTERISNVTPHKTWLQRKRSRKSRAIGFPRLAKKFHEYRLDRVDDRDPNHFLRWRPKYSEDLKRAELPTTSQQRIRQWTSLILDLKWLLRKASYSECILMYCRKIISQQFYQMHRPACRLLRTSLSRYFTRVREERLQELSKRIDEQGDADALMAKSKILYLNAQD